MVELRRYAIAKPCSSPWIVTGLNKGGEPRRSGPSTCRLSNFCQAL